VQEKIPTWGIVTFVLSLIVTFGSLLYANTTKMSEREFTAQQLLIKEQQLKGENLDRRVTIVETKFDNIMEAIRDLSLKLEARSKAAPQ